jgi:hypothetical protein
MRMKNHTAKYLMILLCSGCLFPVAAPAEDDPRFGRLFTESKTRQQLDASRKQNSSERLPVIEEEVEEDQAVTALKVDGMIMRRDGSTEVWVNGSNTRSDSAPSLQGIRHVGGNSLQVPVPGGEVSLKPGQVYSFESRRVLEGYEAAKELAAERQPEEAAIQETTQNFSPAGNTATTAPQARTSDQTAADKRAQFDESELGTQDSTIKLEGQKSNQ